MRDLAEAGEEFFEKHGALTILLARFVAVLKNLSPAIAGASRMRVAVFEVFALIASAAYAALLMAPQALASIVFAPIAGRLVDRVHPRILSGIGLLGMAATIYWLSRVMTPTSATWQILLPALFLGIFSSFVWGTLATGANRNLPPEGITLHPNISVEFATIWADTLKSLDNPRSWHSAVQKACIKRWCELNKRVYQYRYCYTMLGSNVVVKGHAELGNCVVDSNTYVGSTSALHGTIVGKNCDIKAGVTLSEGSAVGDECIIGEQAFVGPNVKIYPFKTVDSGANVLSSIIWESRGTSQLFGKDGVVGLTNVDITAELGLKLAMAYGTVIASYNVEDFGVSRVAKLTMPDVEKRMEEFRDMLAF